MQTIYDSENRPYTLALNLYGVKRARSLLSLDLLEVYSSNPLIGEPGKMLDILQVIDCVYVLVQADAAKHGLTDETWAAAMGPDKMNEAVDAFYKEWELFFRQLNRPDAAGVVQKTAELIRLAVQAADAKVRKIDPSQVVAKGFGNV